MLLTALTPPLFPQGEARAAAEAKAQPLAPRRLLLPPARSKRTATPKNKKAVKELAPRRALPPARTPKKAPQKSKKAVKESKVSY